MTRVLHGSYRSLSGTYDRNSISRKSSVNKKSSLIFHSLPSRLTRVARVVLDVPLRTSFRRVRVFVIVLVLVVLCRASSHRDIQTNPSRSTPCYPYVAPTSKIRVLAPVVGHLTNFVYVYNVIRVVSKFLLLCVPAN